jgi:hypothetical protein
MSSLRTPARTATARTAAPATGPRAAARALAQGLATLMDPPAAAAMGSGAPVMGRGRITTPSDATLPIAGSALPRGWSCLCGRAALFSQSECPGCLKSLGYDPQTDALLALEPVAGTGGVGERAFGAAAGLWRAWGSADHAPRYHRCANGDTAAACNWLVPEHDPHGDGKPLCRSCRLTRSLPDLSLEHSAQWWHRIEVAKRRLVASLLGLGLPVSSRLTEDPERGLVFDLLRATPGGPPVETGHANGVITIDIEEADDTWREQRCAVTGEPYRTLLGHLRHETGRYYWQRLVQPGRWLLPWRELFGDERKDHQAALARHGESGPQADWSQRHVCAYASSHPWEDWCETWAQYLHMVDTIDTARRLGLDGGGVELPIERWGAEVLSGSGDARPREFLQLVNRWLEVTAALNELSRSMGVPDFHRRVLPAAVVRKLHLVHRVISHAHLV